MTVRVLWVTRNPGLDKFAFRASVFPMMARSRKLFPEKGVLFVAHGPDLVGPCQPAESVELLSAQHPDSKEYHQTRNQQRGDKKEQRAEKQCGAQKTER